MKYRMAQEHDLPQILRLLSNLWEKNGKAYPGIEFNEDDTRKTVLDTMRDGIVIVGNKSVAGVVFFNFPYNFKAKVAFLLFWAFENHHGMGIFDEVKELSAMAGATHFTAASHPPHNRIGRWYEKRGLKACEIQHIEELVHIEKTPLKGAK